MNPYADLLFALVSLILSALTYSSFAVAQRQQNTTSPATAEAQAHGRTVTPDAVEWKPRSPGLEIAILSGDPAKEGVPFVLRLKLRDGLRVPPHWHPVDEHLTVMTGTLHVGMGEKFDRAAATAMPAGSYSQMSKEMRHFVWAEGPPASNFTASGHSRPFG